jgi:hypothetical protein
MTAVVEPYRSPNSDLATQVAKLWPHRECEANIILGQFCRIGLHWWRRLDLSELVPSSQCLCRFQASIPIQRTGGAGELTYNDFPGTRESIVSALVWRNRAARNAARKSVAQIPSSSHMARCDAGIPSEAVNSKIMKLAYRHRFPTTSDNPSFERLP